MAILYPISQRALSAKMQNYMDEVAKQGSEQAGSFPVLTWHRLNGMEMLATELGIDCDCFHTDWTPETQGRMMCKCRPMSARERKQSLSGAHCRDKAGEFVPVPQCSGHLPADIMIAAKPLPKAKRKRKKKRS